MAAVQGQTPNTDPFDAYFKIADLDRDGRISGAEAVTFFQGFNLPKETLALVWSYAAGGNSSLGRTEFYNALRLVTVAQSGRQLTGDIVKAALYGPAAVKIPAPKINPSSSSSLVGQMNNAATSAAQANQIGTLPVQTGFLRPPASLVNSMPDSSPQAEYIRPPTSQKPVVSLPQSSQPGFMRPPVSQMKPTLQQPHPPLQGGFTRPSSSQLTGISAQQRLSTTDLNPLGSPYPQSSSLRPQIPQVSGLQQGFSQGFQAANTVANPGLPSLSTSAMSTDWLAGRSSNLPGAASSQFPNHVIAHSTQEAASQPQIQQAVSSSVPSKLTDQTTFLDSKPSVVSGNGFTSNTVFGGDIFLANQTKQGSSIPISSTTNFSNSFKVAPVAPKSHMNLGQPANQQVTAGLPPAASQMQRNLPSVKQNQTDPNVQIGPGSSISTQNDVPWPKITQSDIRKYTKVFHEVDKDKDGKITGLEARNLFLSWRLPRDVLRQVWDLSDQDNDSMLSLREFCVALYLMERFREGRSLPSVLPNSVKFDQTLVLLTGQLSSAYASSWQQKTVSSHQPIPESLPVVPPTRVEPSTRMPIPLLPDEVVSQVQQKSSVPVLEQNLVSQLSEEEKKALKLKLEEATDADKKVQELEKEIQDCKLKTENYRKQMQELVLYKSRCDSRLNEIIERIAAEKREKNDQLLSQVDLLARKYEETYKQMGDVASKLSADQATFRDIQERKVELYNSIAKMEQGERSDAVHQEHADKIQIDLDELVKALNDRCKEYGLRSKPTSLVELPFGWQPGIQEGAADWDETWDMFDKDNGFTIIKELTLEVENVVPLEKPKLTSISSVELTTNGETTTSEGSKEVTKVEKQTTNVEEPETKIDGLPSNAEVNADKSFSTEAVLPEVKLSHAHDEDVLARTPLGSPGRSPTESPRDFQSTFSPNAHAKEHHSEHDGVESGISKENFADEVTWGAKFDSDDTDSIWGFNPIKTKDVKRADSFSGHGDFGMNSLGTDSPSAASVFGQERSSPFFDSVPSTPAFNSGFSPRFNNQDSDDRSFDSFSRFDSFSLNDNIFPSSGNLSRFDSMNSSIDPFPNTFSRFDSFSGSIDPSPNTFSRFDSMSSSMEPSRNTFSRFDSMSSSIDPYPNTFSRFDSVSSSNEPSRNAFSRFDSFGSTADAQKEFSRFDSMRSSGEPRETLARFDSIKSSADYNHGFSFDDSDPFGSGPFKPSEAHAQKKNADHWSAF